MLLVIFAAIEIPKFTENWETENIESVPAFVPDLTDELVTLKYQTLATIFSVTNWYFIFQGKSYFDLTGRPPLFENLWSLSIEWQFYLLWPIILWMMLKIFQKKHKRIIICCTVFALISFVSMLMWREFYANESRAYFGTDARCYSLLIGAIFVFFWNKKHEIESWVIDFLGGLSLMIILFLGFNLSGTDGAVYRGGLLLCSLATGGLIISVINQKSKLMRGFFESALLAWIGRRSYSLYLWHWPLFILTEPRYNYQIDGSELFLLRFVFLLGITEVSYQLIEKPFRTGGLEKEMQELKVKKGYRRGMGVLVFGLRSMVALSFLFLCSCAIWNVKTDGFPEGEKFPIAEIVLKEAPDNAVSSIKESDLEPSSEELPMVASDNLSSKKKENVCSVGNNPKEADQKINVQVAAFGDSVMLGAKYYLEKVFKSITVNAVVSRQFTETYRAIQKMKASGNLPQIVFIHAGTNGTIEEKDLVGMMELLKDCQRVVVFNLLVPRGWEERNNKLLASIVPLYHNAILVDWQKEGGSRKEIFYKDGIHLKYPVGPPFYAQLAKNALSTN